MIVSTVLYELEEIRFILKVRCEEEDVKMADELLTRILTEFSLRYAIQVVFTLHVDSKYCNP
jgi:DNA helicase TIP49 (TBP-interacting protein)